MIFVRAMAHILFYALLPFSLLLDLCLVSVGIVVYPDCRGCVKDPQDYAIVLFCVTFPLNSVK